MVPKIPKEQNEYARDIKGNDVYILDVEKGQKNYWCIGCGEEMQAVHRTIENYKAYFRHIAKDIKIERKCTFSNQDYRHKLAIAFLQFTKRIKVPNLYKYSLDGKKAVLLEEAKFIEASTVKAEVTFYEDDDGNVLFGKNPQIDNKNLLIRPDLTFLNSKGEPILLVEIVVSHKIDDEKKVKLRRLGINTIQIIIPKDSEENIVKGLQTSTNTKWVYNDVEQRTNYIQISQGNREDLSSIDEEQRKLFGESFNCRTNQISNLIRSIKRGLESQHYGRIEHQFESELSRVKRNTERNREQLERLREEHRERVYSRYRNTFEQIERDEGELTALVTNVTKEEGKLFEDFSNDQAEQQRYYRRLADRYQQKKYEIEIEGERLNDVLEDLRGIKTKQGTVRDATNRLQNEIDGIRRKSDDTIKSIEEIRRRISLLPAEFEQRGRGINIKYEE